MANDVSALNPRDFTAVLVGIGRYALDPEHTLHSTEHDLFHIARNLLDTGIPPHRIHIFWSSVVWNADRERDANQIPTDWEQQLRNISPHIPEVREASCESFRKFILEELTDVPKKGGLLLYWSGQGAMEGGDPYDDQTLYFQDYRRDDATRRFHLSVFEKKLGQCTLFSPLILYVNACGARQRSNNTAPETFAFDKDKGNINGGVIRVFASWPGKRTWETGEPRRAVFLAGLLDAMSAPHQIPPWDVERTCSHLKDFLATRNQESPVRFHLVRQDWDGREHRSFGEDRQRAFHSPVALPTRETELDYLDELIERLEEEAELYSPLRGVSTVRPEDPPVPKKLSAWKNSPVHLRYLSRSQEERKPESRPYEDILDAYGDVKKAAVLGAPGAGKSTTLRRLAVDLAKRAKDDSNAPLPLLVSMHLWKGDESLDAYLSSQEPAIAWALDALSKAGRIVLLLDALNEMPTASHETKARQVRAMLQQAPVWVSCRLEDYTGHLDLGLDTLELKPLTPTQILTAVTKWVTDSGEPATMAERFFWQLAGDERLASVWKKWEAAKATFEQFWSASHPRDHKAVWESTTRLDDELWLRHIPNRRCLVHLASNPFMLTMFYHVWIWGDGILPKNRSGLFQRFIQRLLDREHLVNEDDTCTPDGIRLLDALAALAWQAQYNSHAEGSLTVIPKADALAAMGPQLLRKTLDSTLLEGGEELRFRHQLLQEYFAAKTLQARMHTISASELWPAGNWWERSRWEETAVLLAGFYPKDCTPVIRWLAAAQPEVAAQCIEESGAGFADKPALLRELQSAWKPRLLDPACEPRIHGRAAIGRALARLDLDDRPGIGVNNRVPQIDWVEIPAGHFQYQDEKKRRKNDRFWIARYPVTNAQFNAFLNAADGYKDARWWKGLDDADRTPRAPYWSHSNHPRESVSWYEATAFCSWLSYKLGCEVRLPFEWEWERAARGADGKVYPWGKKFDTAFANTRESELGRTTAVGLHPQGASEEGVLDLSGNVWEWCSNKYHEDNESRVLRGGSWSYNSQNARADSRYDHPCSRYDDVGYRVVRSAPITDH